jgi:hypothetical protein
MMREGCTRARVCPCLEGKELDCSRALLSEPSARVERPQVAAGAFHEEDGKEAGLHHPGSRLLYREFVEALVRVAHHVFVDAPTLERRMHRLLSLHILPHAGKVRVACAAQR